MLPEEQVPDSRRNDQGQVIPVGSDDESDYDSDSEMIHDDHNDRVWTIPYTMHFGPVIQRPYLYQPSPPMMVTNTNEFQRQLSFSDLFETPEEHGIWPHNHGIESITNITDVIYTGFARFGHMVDWRVLEFCDIKKEPKIPKAARRKRQRLRRQQKIPDKPPRIIIPRQRKQFIPGRTLKYVY